MKRPMARARIGKRLRTLRTMGSLHLPGRGNEIHGVYPGTRRTMRV